MKLKNLIFLFFSLLISSSLYAQVTTGDLQGVITDEYGQPVSEAEVIISGPSLIGNLGAASNESGNFRISAIPPGQYRVEIKHLSYQTLIIDNVDVFLGRTTSMGDVTLEPGTVELEEVVAAWTRPAIDPTSTTLGAYIDPQTLNSLPIERDYKSILTILPQINTSYYGDNANILGSSGSDNVYYIDGMNVTDPFKASGGLTIPFNFIKGVDVKQGGYEAEFGKASGGIINVVTPSGSNEFEASAFSYFTGDALTGKQKDESLSPRDIKGFANYDLGLSAGGPIIKDKFWYFLAYNPIFENQDIKVLGYEPRKDKNTTHAYAAKLNWIALNNTRFTLSIIGNQSKHNRVGYASGFTGIPRFEVRNIDLVLAEITDGGINLAMDVVKNTRSGILLSGTFVYNNWNYEEGGQTDIGKIEPFYEDHVEYYVSGGYGHVMNINSQRMSLKLKGEWGWKQHSISGGLEAEIMYLDMLWKSHNQGWLFREDINYYTACLINIDGIGMNIVPGIFLQDSWQLFSKLRLNYGLRWDAQLFRGPVKGHDISITDQVQPRLGLVYTPGNSGKYKFTAHFARFYAQYPLYCVSDKIFPYDNPVYGYDTDPRVPGTAPVDTLLAIYSDEPAQIIDSIKLHGEFSDEFLIGFETQLPHNLKIGLKCILRNLKNGLANFFTSEGVFVVGNPGSGILNSLPSYKRNYTALELSLGTNKINNFNFFTSYVLSVNKGNYTGFFDQDNAQSNEPGNYCGLQVQEQVINCYGYMPNDHRHVFKFNASYKFNFGLTAGTTFWIMSGAPYNEFGTSPMEFKRYIYLVERGTAGRLPTIWDLNLRLTYDLDITSVHGKIFLDAMHVGSPRKTVKVDEVKYFDYEMTNLNDNYGNVLQYQPPMMIRIGLNIDI